MRTAKGKERYTHRMLMAVQVMPGQDTALPLEAEEI